MPRTAWNDDEQAALRGLSMLAQLIYLRVFRRRMDYRTGIAGGLGHRITATSIAEEVAFIPDPRSTKKPWVPTRGEIRAAIAELERPRPIDGDPEWRVSLLVEAGSRLDTGYVKQLPLADRGASVQKMNNPRAPQEQPTDTNPVNTPPQAAPDQAGRAFGGRAQPDERPDRSAAVPAKSRPSSGVPVSGREEVLTHPVRDGQPSAPPSGAHHTGLATESVSTDPAAGCIDPVLVVFRHWQQVMNKPKARLDAKRRAAVAGRLKDGYPVADLLTAIDGCKASAWHQGRNDRQRPFNDLGLICRDSAHVEQFIELARGQQAADAKLEAFLNGAAHPHTLEGEFHVVRQ